MPNNQRGEIQSFFGLDFPIKSLDLDWTLENLGVPRPTNLLPIACTDGADFLCVNMTEDDGSVVFWDRHACWGQDHWDSKDFYPITDSFTGLLVALSEW